MTPKNHAPKRALARKPKRSAAPPRLRTKSTAAVAVNQPGTPPARTRSFPIVGIGASAGGLEAFTQLVSHLPGDTGVAFVLVQHLDPKHESMLTELLSRATPLRVLEVRDGMRIEPDHIYVIPPNTSMAISHGRLNLVPRPPSRRQHLPIDFFFRSLADDQKSRAIAVVLSGTGSDGAEGLRAIKAEGGLTFAQDEKSARYDGMPHSSIAAGVVDFVLPPEGIARELARIGRHPYLTLPSAARTGEAPPEDEAALRQVFVQLRSATGVDFSFYKPTTLKRRIARRMVLQKIDSLANYARFLKQTPDEADALYQDLLINVTSFFREPEAFEALRKKVFPRLMKDRPPQSPIRVWVPGCSTGEEAYSIAICLLEYLGNTAPNTPIQIFATDISDQAIEKARQGMYPESITADVAPARLRRFFVKHKTGYQITTAIRDLCVFARQDVTRDPPFSKLDLISCRNLLIYLGPELQKRVMSAFHYALKATGVLLLGSSETIGAFADLFALIDRKQKLYARKSTPLRTEFDVSGYRHPLEAVPSSPVLRATEGGFDFQREADRILLARYIPASVMVNDRLDILQFRGHTGPYLEPSAGAATFNLLKMAREGLQLELRSAIHESRTRRTPVRRTGVRVKSNGGFREVNVDVIPLKSSPQGKAGCFLVLFEEAVRATTPLPSLAKPKRARVLPAEERVTSRLQHELVATREYLQSVIDEHERTNEELQAANEEILSSNEELQSTNEEVETAKEELQSANEELNTVNDELHTRNAELGQLNSDLVNLFTSVQIPIVMLSRDLRIRRFNQPAEKVLNLLPRDVGRPLSDLRLNLEVPELGRLISEVIETLVPKEFDTQDRDGCWYSLRLRPYKTVDNKIDGVVLALVDIDAMKRALREASEARAYAEAIVETVREPLLVLNSDLCVKTANRAFYQMFQARPEETENRCIFSLANDQWNIPRLRELLEEILPKSSRFENFEVDAVFAGAGPKHLLLNARRLTGESQQLILLAIQERTPCESATS